MPERLIAVGLEHVFVRQIANASGYRVLGHQFTIPQPAKSISFINVHRQRHSILRHQVVLGHISVNVHGPSARAQAHCLGPCCEAGIGEAGRPTPYPPYELLGCALHRTTRSRNRHRRLSSDRRFPYHAPPHWLNAYHPATYGWVIFHPTSTHQQRPHSPVPGQTPRRESVYRCANPCRVGLTGAQMTDWKRIGSR